MFNRLAIWQRLFVLSLAFMIPVLALLYFLVGEQSLAIDFARKELAGVEYFRAARPLLASLLADRDLRIAVSTGASLRVSEIASRSEAIDDSFASLQRSAGALSIPLVAAGGLSAIERRWGEPEQRAGAAGTAVIEELLRHVVAIGNESNLVLDPDVDSYYCMDAVVFKLPKLLTELSDVRGQVLEVTAGLENGAAPDAGQRETLQALAVTLGEALAATRDNIEFGYRYNPEVERRLGARFRDTGTHVERIVAILTGFGDQPRRADVLFDDATAAIDATFLAYDAALDMLQGLIEQRIAAFERRRIVSLSVVAISLLIGFAIVFSIQRYMEARNHDLSQALDRLTLTQSQLVESEKMAALGGMVAGIAHEINTPIGIGVTATTSLDDESRRLETLAASGRMTRSDLAAYVQVSRDCSRLILSNLNRASDLIQSFKQVAVDQSSERRRQFYVKGYLEEILQSLYPRLKKTTHTVSIFGDETLLLDSYPGALAQIVTNLVTNSLVHAYEPGHGGTITIRAEAVDGGVRLTYSDDGKGVPARHLDKIFDPFFTTKRGQGGSGLGLNIVYNLVTQRLKGQIRCESQEGAGTTFVVDIPDLSPSAAISDRESRVV